MVAGYAHPFKQPALPDLIVLAIVPAANPVCLNDPVSFNVVIVNQGAVASGPFDFAVFNDATNCTGSFTLISEQVGINAGASKSYGVSVVFPHPGTGSFSIHSDYNLMVSETDEFNNCLGNSSVTVFIHTSVWKGTGGDDNWQNSANWQCGLPTIIDTAIIPPQAVLPVLYSGDTAYCKQVLLFSSGGASLEVQIGAELIIQP